MGKYVPHTETHSIQEATIAVHFQGELEPGQIELTRGRVQAHLDDHFGRSQQIRGGNIDIDMTNPERPKPASGVVNVVGFEFSRPDASGTPDRILRFSNKTLLASFKNYTGWDSVLEDSLTYIKAVLSSMPLMDCPVGAFGLRYVDRYSYEGPASDAHAALLFEKDGPYITAQCFNAGPLWHCHSGWFEDLTAEERILNQLNVGSNVIDGISTVTIDHNAVWMLKSIRHSIETLLSSANGSTGLQDALIRLHANNKEILKAMLRRGMLDTIGMAQ